MTNLERQRFPGAQNPMAGIPWTGGAAAPLAVQPVLSLIPGDTLTRAFPKGALCSQLDNVCVCSHLELSVPGHIQLDRVH